MEQNNQLKKILILWEITLPIKLQVNQIKWNLLRLLTQLKKYHKVSSLMETKKTPKEIYISAENKLMIID